MSIRPDKMGAIIVYHFGYGVVDFFVIGGKLIWNDKNITEPSESDLELWEIEYDSYMESL